ncbi:MAG: alpha/beta hydrolase [Bacteroidota bacterium]|nr:alpha/beta hydrolase [Bacteroidota bacterium]MDP3146806.1 alpha/beta hydrolase [Bacteroidota bacterium]
MSSCFMLNKYIYTDKELSAHFENENLKPSYKKVLFLNHALHYAVISKSDSLPLLVFVHGAPGAWYGYLNLMDDTLLQQNYKLIAIDRLGYGKSNYGVAETSTQLQALAIKEIIDKENFTGKKVVLLGRSYGAPIAAWLSINYPKQIKKLFMVSPVIDPQNEKFYWFSGIAKWKAIQWMLPKMFNVATEEKYSHEHEMTLMLPEWEKLHTPTFVITGENDKIADTCNFSFARTHLNKCESVFLKLQNTGHLITYEKPELIRNLLLQNM